MAGGGGVPHYWARRFPVNREEVHDEEVRHRRRRRVRDVQWSRVSRARIHLGRGIWPLPESVAHGRGDGETYAVRPDRKRHDGDPVRVDLRARADGEPLARSGAALRSRDGGARAGGKVHHVLCDPADRVRSRTEPDPARRRGDRAHGSRGCAPLQITNSLATDFADKGKTITTGSILWGNCSFGTRAVVAVPPRIDPRVIAFCSP